LSKILFVFEKDRLLFHVGSFHDLEDLPADADAVEDATDEKQKA
jgi:hypothetical protein